MKKILIILAFLSLTSYAFTQEKGIKFEKELNWAQIKAKAKAENKFIFLDAFATWCGPCKWMDENSYNTTYAEAFFKDKFICVKVQMDSTKNDNHEVKLWHAQALKMLKDYQITSFPTLLYFDPDANLVHKFTGAVSDSTLVQISSKALNPEGQYFTLLKQYKAKTLPYAEIPHLLKLSTYAGEVAQVEIIASDYIDNYLFKLKQEDLMKKENLLFISAHLNDTRNKGFAFFMKERQKVNTILGADKAEYAIRSAIAKEYVPKEGEWLTKKPNWNLLQKQVSVKFGAIGDEMILGKRMSYYSSIKDWANYGKYYQLYFEKALRRPEFNINHMSYYLVLYGNDQKVLTFAADVVMKHAMEEWYQSNFAAWDTYAGLLYKIGRKEEAIAWEEKGLKALKGSPSEKSFADVLEKMKKGIPIWPTTPVNN